MGQSASPPAAPFRDRAEAGARLAQLLSAYRDRPDTLVVALPRGGVPVAAEIAAALRLPLDICLVRKLGVPAQPELAMGAIASHGVQVLNHDIIERLGITEATLAAVAEVETQELKRRDHAYRQGRPPLDVSHQTVILVDDGVATGSTLRAAIAVLKAQQPDHLIVAVPIAPPSTVAELRREVDEVVCPLQPEPLYSISLWYRRFDQTSDATVCDLLRQAQDLSSQGLA